MRTCQAWGVQGGRKLTGYPPGVSSSSGTLRGKGKVPRQNYMLALLIQVVCPTDTLRALARTVLEAKNEHPRSKVKDTVMHSNQEGHQCRKIHLFLQRDTVEKLAHAGKK